VPDGKTVFDPALLPISEALAKSCQTKPLYLVLEKKV
jgi:hypothetical protein